MRLSSPVQSCPKTSKPRGEPGRWTPSRPARLEVQRWRPDSDSWTTAGEVKKAFELPNYPPTVYSICLLFQRRCFIFVSMQSEGSQQRGDAAVTAVLLVYETLAVVLNLVKKKMVRNLKLLWFVTYLCI